MSAKLSYSWMKNASENPYQHLGFLDAHREVMLSQVPRDVSAISNEIRDEWNQLTIERDKMFRKIWKKEMEKYYSEHAIVLYDAIKEYRRLQSLRMIDHTFPALDRAFYQVVLFLKTHNIQIPHHSPKSLKKSNVEREISEVAETAPSIPENLELSQSLTITPGNDPILPLDYSLRYDLIENTKEFQCEGAAGEGLVDAEFEPGATSTPLRSPHRVFMKSKLPIPTYEKQFDVEEAELQADDLKSSPPAPSKQADSPTPLPDHETLNRSFSCPILFDVPATRDFSNTSIYSVPSSGSRRSSLVPSNSVQRLKEMFEKPHPNAWRLPLPQRGGAGSRLNDTAKSGSHNDSVD